MDDVYVHPHALKHGLSEDEIVRAWSNFVKNQQRECPREDQCVRVGYCDTRTAAIQMIGIMKPHGTLIIHAMTPPQAAVLDELGMPRRRQ